MLKKHIKLNLSKHHITVSNDDKIKLETALDCMRQVAFSVKFEVCRVFESEVWFIDTNCRKTP